MKFLSGDATIYGNTNINGMLSGTSFKIGGDCHLNIEPIGSSKKWQGKKRGCFVIDLHSQIFVSYMMPGILQSLQKTTSDINSGSESLSFFLNKKKWYEKMNK